jgi:PAS domain S-box-containing protein
MTKSSTTQTAVAASHSASELRYRRLFETAQDGILTLDFKTGQIEDVNPFLKDLLGYSHEELVGKRLWEIGAIIDKKASQDAFDVLQTEGYIRYEDLPLMTKSGAIISVEFVSNAYAVGDDKVIQCNIRDITQRKRIARELLEYQRLVSSGMSEMVDVLSAMIEARDPYTAGHQGRVASNNLQFFVVAVLIQLETGGNLTELLKTLSTLIRDRRSITSRVRVLTAEGRLSAWILGLLPFGIGLLLAAINPEFISKLWTDPMGIRMLQVSLALMALGVWWMWRMVRIKI